MFLVYAVFALPWGVSVLASIAYTLDFAYGPSGITLYNEDAVRLTDVGLVGIYLFCQASVINRSIQAIRNNPDDEDDLARTVAIGIILNIILGIAASAIAGSLGSD